MVTMRRDAIDEVIKVVSMVETGQLYYSILPYSEKLYNIVNDELGVYKSRVLLELYCITLNSIELGQVSNDYDIRILIQSWLNRIGYDLNTTGKHKYATNYFYYKNGHLRFKADAPPGVVPQPIGFFDYSYMFEGVSSDNIYDISHWDVSSIIYANSMFESSNIILEKGIGSWNMSNVLSTAGMFENCKKPVGDLSSWSLPNVVDVSSMFRNTYDIDFGDINSWALSNVKYNKFFIKNSKYQED